MPDIDALVARWRTALVRLLPGREDVLDELEGHLRDDIDRRVAAGEAPESAFLQAEERLGPGAAIAAEFAKVPVAPRPWLPARVAWVAAVCFAVAAFLWLLPRFRRGGLDAVLAGHMAGVLLGYLSAALVACLAAAYLVARLFREPGPGQRLTIRSTATGLTGAAAVLTLGGVVLGTWCPFDKAGWCWGLDTREVGGLAIAAWSALLLPLTGLGRRANGLLAPMALGAAGGIVVVLGWPAAARFEGHATALTSVPLIVALAAACVVAGLTALAPAGCLRPHRA